MSKIGLIISREFTQRVRKRSFLIVTLLMPLAMAALIVVPMFLAMYGQSDERREVVVLDRSGVVASALAGTQHDNVLFLVPEDSSVCDHTAAGIELPGVYGFLEVDSSVVDHPSGLRLYTRSASTAALEATVRRAVSDVLRGERIKRTGVASLDSLLGAVEVRASVQTFEIDPKNGSTVEKSSAVAMGLAYVGGFLIYIFVLVYGMMVMQGVVEEKTNRIVEVLVSSVRPFELMMGKIIGIALVALLQFLVWMVVGAGLLVLFSSQGGQVELAAGIPLDIWVGLVDPMMWLRVGGSFVLYFVGGYLLYASMFAAVGSAVDNASDTQQLQMPITMPLVVSIVLMMSVMQDPNSSLAFWASMVPLSSPVIMMGRVAYGVPLWEFLLSLGLLYGSFVGMTWVAAKIYRTGILMYGKKVTLGQMVRWIRLK